MIQTPLTYPNLDTLEDDEFILEWQLINYDKTFCPGIIMIDKNRNFCGLTVREDKMILFSNDKSRKSIIYNKNIMWILIDSLEILENLARKDFDHENLLIALQLCHMINSTFRASSTKHCNS